MDILQLGLTLSSNNNVDSTKGFDLNCYICEPTTQFSGSDSVSQLDSCSSSCESTSELDNSSKKRCLCEAFDQVSQLGATRTLPLLHLWNNYPIEDHDGDDHGRELDKNSSTTTATTTAKSDGDEEGVVGWPPVNSWRKRICCQNHGGENMVVGNYQGGVGAKSSYVKVKMEGVAIARKVDLSAHHSYETLTDKLAGMFGGEHINVKAYTLTYQDKEGDWLLAGDVPWSSFIQSVQRLKLVKEQ